MQCSIVVQYIMSVRCVWVISTEKRPLCVFSRRYPTVERRAKLLPGYFALPSDDDLVNAVLTVVSSETTFNAQQDSCESIQSPVHWLFNRRLGPLLLVSRQDLLFAGLALSNQPSITCALTLLEALTKTVSSPLESSMVVELGKFLSVCSPFGTPLDLYPGNVNSKLNPAKNKSLSDKQKSPSWSVGVYRGPPKVALSVHEEIQAVQYDKPGVKESVQISGMVLCKAEVDGCPDIQLVIATPTDKPDLIDTLYHPIVHADDAHHHGNQRKLRFSAPLDGIALFQYQYPSPLPLPIRAFYQMKGEGSVRLLIQLKLNESVRNNFEFCDVHIPFFNRGTIDQVDCVVPSVLATALTVSADRKTVIWSIGQKFPARGLELSLQATVHFKEGPEENMPFYVGSNSYIEIYFKIMDFTLSGATIDPKSVNVLLNTKPRVSINRELCSSSYRVWNSHGDALFTYPQQMP